MTVRSQSRLLLGGVSDSAKHVYETVYWVEGMEFWSRWKCTGRRRYGAAKRKSEEPIQLDGVKKQEGAATWPDEDDAVRLAGIRNPQGGRGVSVSATAKMLRRVGRVAGQIRGTMVVFASNWKVSSLLLPRGAPAEPMFRPQARMHLT